MTYALDSQVLALLSQADPNNQDVLGNTPLHHSKSSESIEFLLAIGANPLMKNIFEKFALDLHANNEKVEGK